MGGYVCRVDPSLSRVLACGPLAGRISPALTLSARQPPAIIISGPGKTLNCLPAPGALGDADPPHLDPTALYERDLWLAVIDRPGELLVDALTRRRIGVQPPPARQVEEYRDAARIEGRGRERLSLI